MADRGRRFERERAIRAASERQPLVPKSFVIWVLGRLLALAVLLGAGWLVYQVAESDRFLTRSVDVHGNVLLGRAELERVVAVKGINVFWIDTAAVEARLRALPLVLDAHVHAYLPDRVEVRIVERQPVAFWISGDRSYLVDREGVILKSVDAEAQQARACAGQPCDPRLAPLPTVAQVDGQPLNAGERVDAAALRSSASLAAILPLSGIQPLAFEWSADVGLEVPTREGWRIRFDTARELDRQIRTVVAVREHLGASRTSASVIDVRFGDRPYFR